MIKYLLRKFSNRNETQLRLHYKVEKSIADKLKNGSRNERKLVYKTMYDELFEKIPNHSRLQRRGSISKTNKNIKHNLYFLKKHLKNINSFLEFAPGDGKLSLKIANIVQNVYTVDISNQFDKNEKIPNNMKQIIYDGYRLDFKNSLIDIVFSNQLIEHFHPEDTKNHFEITYNILKPEGCYIFKTPHSFSGPWDVSRYFSNIPEGFHLKEWTYSELIKLLKNIGFKKITTYYYVKYFFFKLPAQYFIAAEQFFSIFPKNIRRAVSFPFLPHIAIKAEK